MRRALLLAALALPALASAQAEGVVVNGTSQSSAEIVADDEYINIEECVGAANTGIGPIELFWRVKLASGTLNGGAFKIYATNDAGKPGTTEPRYCQTQDNLTASPVVYAAQIGGDVTATVGQPTKNADFSTREIVLAATEGASFTCDETLADQTITICAHYHPATGGGGVASDPAGWAVGQLTLSLRRPPPPPATGMSVRGGEGALEVRWAAAPSPGSQQATATGYRVIVRLASGGPAVTFEDVTGTSARIEGLVNGTEYEVSVFSLSAARNVSATGVAMNGTPVPTADFWEFYRSSGGVEQGGCGAGAAGPLALLALAGLLAALRRRA